MSDQKKVTIDRIDMETGWVVFQPDKENPPSPAQSPGLLNTTFSKWLVNTPENKHRRLANVAEQLTQWLVWRFYAIQFTGNVVTGIDACGSHSETFKLFIRHNNADTVY